MATLIGNVVEKTGSAETLRRARARAALLPDLLTESRYIANNAISGWHGRRKRGIGENFWQFRPYVDGESLAKIDWRRSARDEHIYIQDKEWQAAHTLWVWADNSPSMLYKSRLADVSKQSRAMVLALALCELLARSGERIGWPGVTRPLVNRDAAERIALELGLRDNQDTFPPTDHIKRYSEIILISDFLEPLEQLFDSLSDLAHRGIRGHLIHIVDPAEELFPFSGRTEFIDPKTSAKFVSGRAENLSEEYRTVFAARKKSIAAHVGKFDWSYIVHHTDKLASTALVILHQRLGQTIGPMTETN